MPPERVLMVLSNGFTHDSRVAAEAESLDRAGFRVTVLAWDRAGGLPPEETKGGIQVLRIRNSLGMTLRVYDIFRLKPFWRLALRRALALHAARRFDVVHCHDFDTLPMGVWFKERTGAKLVYDAHEVFPYLLEVTKAKRWAAKFEAHERSLVPRADLVVAAGPGHRDYLRLMTEARIAVVMNSKRLPWDTYEPTGTDRMTVAYFGGLAPSRLLLPLAELAVEDDSFRVDVAGGGPLLEPIRALASKSRGNLRYLGRLPMDEVLPRTRASDVVFSVFDPSFRLNRIGTPNKFFEALAAARPVLASRGTWLGEEVERAQCGLAIDYTKDALREAIGILRDDSALRETLGRNALRLAKERYNWAREEATLLGAYRQLTG